MFCSRVCKSVVQEQLEYQQKPRERHILRNKDAMHMSGTSINNLPAAMQGKTFQCGWNYT